MAQQPNSASQYSYGPASNGGGDVFHFIPANSNPSAGRAFTGWYDNNGLFDGVSGETNALANGAPASLVAAGASTNIFSTTALALPGNSAYEGVPFTVKAAGYLTLNAGTYTATVQPIVYGSTASGFTASTAAAVLSTTAVSLTVTSAVALNFPWEAEVVLVGNTVGGILGGRVPAGAIAVGPNGTIAPAPSPSAPVAPSNSPTGINFATATPPVQFLVGVTTVGAGLTATTTVLQSFFLES